MSGQQTAGVPTILGTGDADLIERLERAEVRIERLSAILADLLGEAVREPQRQRPLRAVK
ncbi:hypothetical protein SAMN05443665_10283 [Actinomadura meyerae]|uniref:Uncharacterized protein n=1 Tax=Actinomadura meyerae TaxID=240840 RepID=A0A239MGE5_9ACTN|nr:hypothetical protein [Actinomadura meyerae]SNT41253.1 hypothetical protein SAMN05443665_10283 [Actinomadura meyerae]